MVGFATPLMLHAGVKAVPTGPLVVKTVPTCVLSSQTVILWYGDFSWPAQGTSGTAQESPCPV